MSYASVSNSDDKTPVMFSSFHNGVDLERAMPWSPPNYSKQENSIGYGLVGFGVPAGMEERVSFWLDIYTKYNTDQGVLHDSRYVHIIYEDLDFTDIMAKSDLTKAQKRKLRKKRMIDAKDKIRSRLRRLQKLSSPAGLAGEDLRYWYLFAEVNEKNKFSIAAKDGRLRFQLGQKDRFLEGIYHSGRYIKEMEIIFKQYELPLELTRLPFVESSFNLNARSRVGASGIWQFMRSTGRQLMKIDGAVDERNDPIRATHAAAKTMRKNFNMLGNWPLAVTGYNHGAYGMRRLVKKYQTDNLVDIVNVRRGRFGFASASFYASFLAAVEAEKRAEKYFGVVFRENPLESQQIKMSKRFSQNNLLSLFDGDKELAKKYNPHLRRYFWQGYRNLKKGHYISVPQKNYEMCLAKYKAIKVPGKLVAKGGRYKILRGDTLGQVARNFNISLRVLMDANGISNPRRVQIGQSLIIPE